MSKHKIFNKSKPDQMERDLEALHREGQALKTLRYNNGWKTPMVFEDCQPEEMVYRCHIYRPKSKTTLFYPERDFEYRRLFEDADWEMVASSDPYVVFRKPRRLAQHPNDLVLHTDRYSLYQYRKQILKAKMRNYVTLLIPALPFLFKASSWRLDRGFYTIFFYSLVLFLLSVFLRLAWQFYCLKKEYSK